MLSRWIACGALFILMMGGTAESSAFDLDALTEAIEELRWEGRYAEAVTVAEAGLAEVREQDGLPEFFEGNCRRMLEVMEVINAMDAQQQEEMTQARQMLLEGVGLYYEGDTIEGADLVRRYYETCHRLLGPAHHELADAALFYGDLISELGEFATADALYAEAVTIVDAQFEQDHPIREILYNNRADTAEQLGLREVAISLRRRALELCISFYGYDDEATGTSLNNLGSSLMEAGRFAEADRYLEQAVVVRRRQGSPQEVFQALHNRANLMYQMGRHDEALAIFDEAFAFAAETDSVGTVIMSAARSVYSGLVEQQGDPAEALAILDEVVAVRSDELPSGDISTANARLERGLVRARLGQHAAAGEDLDAAVAAMEAVYAPGNPELIRAYRNRAAAAWLAGDPARAEVDLQAAADTYEMARLGLNRWGTMASFETPWFQLAACLMVLDRPAEAWRATEAGLGRQLGDALTVDPFAGLTEQERSELTRLDHAVDRARARLLGGDEAGADLEVILQDVLKAEASRAEFGREVGRGIAAQGGRPLDLPRVQRALADDEAVVGWLQSDPGLTPVMTWAYVIRNHGPVHWTDPLPAADGPDGLSAGEGLRRALRRGGAVDAAAGRVWRERLAACAVHLEGVRALVVVPSGGMLGVPVGLATTGRDGAGPELQYVSYAPSAGVLARLRAAGEGMAGREGRPILALGSPPFRPAHGDPPATAVLAIRGADEGRADSAGQADVLRSAMSGDRAALEALPPLHHAATEVRAVHALGGDGSRLLVGADCHERNLDVLIEGDALRGFRVVHVATHALIDPVAPQRSCLVLSQLDLPDPETVQPGEPYHDGLITAEEVARDWRLDADLVVLSGCDTGLGRRQLGEGYLGFVNAFLSAGARSVLVSLWPVHDHSTSLLMQRFYELYLGAEGEPLGKAEALVQAKQWLRDYRVEDLQTCPYSDPWFWSGFVLVGDPD